MSVELSAPAGKLLRLLQFRDGVGPMYLAHAGRGRYAVVVTEMTAAGGLARIDAVSRDTVYELHHVHALIEVADWQQAERLPYAGRRHLDDPQLLRVELLAAGRAACPTCGAIGAEPCWSDRPGLRHRARPAEPQDARG